MMNNVAKSDGCVEVHYSCVDGAHFFTSKDDVAKGLCAASSDLLTAFNEVSHQLTTLLHKNHSLTVKCTPEVSFEEFHSWVNEMEKTQKAKRHNFKPILAAELHWGNAA